MQVLVQGDADRFRRMEVGLPVVIDDDHRVQQAGAHFPEHVAQQAVVGILQPVRVPGDQLIRQVPGDLQGALGNQVPVLALAL